MGGNRGWCSWLVLCYCDGLGNWWFFVRLGRKGEGQERTLPIT